MVSAGAMLLDQFGPPGFRFNDFEAPRYPFITLYARADGQAVVCPLLRGSSSTRGVAPKQHRGPRVTLSSPSTRALMARRWSARCYGVARPREGSRQNSIGGSGVLSLRHFGLVLYPLESAAPRPFGESVVRG